MILMREPERMLNILKRNIKPHEFMKMAKSRGLTEEPEGGLRCTDVSKCVWS